MPVYRKVCWTSAEVKCPFYMGDDRTERSIRCEGYSEKTEVVSKFRSMKQKEAHMGMYCVNKYERCPMYRCTYGEKYADD